MHAIGPIVFAAGGNAPSDGANPRNRKRIALGFKPAYEAENRILAIRRDGPGGGDGRIGFAYDYRNRCVRKLVYA